MMVILVLFVDVSRCFVYLHVVYLISHSELSGSPFPPCVYIFVAAFEGTLILIGLL